MSTLSLSSLASNMSKKQMSNEVNGTLECSRSLNDFHDSILKHILSFLPTKFLVRTSVLSKRWQFLWPSLPNIDFTDDDHKDRKHFISFVERALILRNVPTVHKFSLRCRVINDVSRIKMWISAAVSRNTQEFDITFRDRGVLPLCLFKCETMEVLKLDFDFCVEFPSQIYLPRLKILLLKYLHFKDYHPTNLLFASPALEQIELEHCTWEGHTSALVISAPKLWNLTIIEWPGELTEDIASSSVTISAPQVKTFSYTGGLITDYRLPHSSSITKSILRFYDGDISDTPVDHFDEFLRSIQLVKHLQLSYLYFKVLSKVTVPIFKNLIILEILDGPVDPSCEELEMFLNKCPCLETLKFPKGFSLDSVAYKSDRLLSLKLVYLPSTLKNIMIGNFTGSITEIFTVQILLAQMTSLESLKITLSGEGVAKRTEINTVLSALSSHSKKSCICQVL